MHTPMSTVREMLSTGYLTPEDYLETREISGKTFLVAKKVIPKNSLFIGGEIVASPQEEGLYFPVLSRIKECLDKTRNILFDHLVFLPGVEAMESLLNRKPPDFLATQNVLSVIKKIDEKRVYCLIAFKEILPDQIIGYQFNLGFATPRSLHEPDPPKIFPAFYDLEGRPLSIGAEENSLALKKYVISFDEQLEASLPLQELRCLFLDSPRWINQHRLRQVLQDHPYIPKNLKISVPDERAVQWFKALGGEVSAYHEIESVDEDPYAIFQGRYHLAEESTWVLIFPNEGSSFEQFKNFFNSTPIDVKLDESMMYVRFPNTLTKENREKFFSKIIQWQYNFLSALEIEKKYELNAFISQNSQEQAPERKNILSRIIQQKREELAVVTHQVCAYMSQRVFTQAALAFSEDFSKEPADLPSRISAGFFQSAVHYDAAMKNLESIMVMVQNREPFFTEMDFIKANLKNCKIQLAIRGLLHFAQEYTNEDSLKNLVDENGEPVLAIIGKTIEALKLSAESSSFSARDFLR